LRLFAFEVSYFSTIQLRKTRMALHDNLV
jgi:hypothetical protein